MRFRENKKRHESNNRIESVTDTLSFSEFSKSSKLVKSPLKEDKSSPNNKKVSIVVEIGEETPQVRLSTGREPHEEKHNMTAREGDFSHKLSKSGLHQDSSAYTPNRYSNGIKNVNLLQRKHENTRKTYTDYRKSNTRAGSVVSMRDKNNCLLSNLTSKHKQLLNLSNSIMSNTVIFDIIFRILSQLLQLGLGLLREN